MSSPASCPPDLLPVSLPAEFSQLCRSVLARDPLYSRLMADEPAPAYDNLAGLRYSYAQENTPFLLGSGARAALRTHNS